jgi:hypothetical protein
MLIAGAILVSAGLVAGTLPSAWACAERAAESRCCCPEREAPEGRTVEAACCCVAPDPAERSAPDPQLERPARPELAPSFVAVAAPAVAPMPAAPLRRAERALDPPPTLVTLHTSLRC